MCSAVAIAAIQLGVNITSTVGEDRAKNQAAEATQVAAESDLFNKYNAVQAREQQEMAKTQQEIFNVRQQGRSNSSRIRAQAASGGVAGSTIDAREAAPGIAATNFEATAKVNLANTLRQQQLDAASFKAEDQSRINEAEGEKVSAGAEALQIGGEVAQAAPKVAPSVFTGGLG